MRYELTDYEWAAIKPMLTAACLTAVASGSCVMTQVITDDSCASIRKFAADNVPGE
jgi:hypothetical protein